MGNTFSGVSIVQSGLAISQNNFIKEYGKYSVNYSLVDALGNQESYLGFITFIFLIFFTIIMFILSQPSKKDKDKQRTFSQKIFYIIAFISLFGCGISGMFSLVYFIMYKIQFVKWLANLPGQGQLSYATISATQDLVETVNMQNKLK